MFTSASLVSHALGRYSLSLPYRLCSTLRISSTEQAAGRTGAAITGRHLSRHHHSRPWPQHITIRISNRACTHPFCLHAGVGSERRLYNSCQEWGSTVSVPLLACRGPKFQTKDNEVSQQVIRPVKKKDDRTLAQNQPYLIATCITPVRVCCPE